MTWYNGRGCLLKQSEYSYTEVPVHGKRQLWLQNRSYIVILEYILEWIKLCAKLFIVGVLRIIIG